MAGTNDQEILAAASAGNFETVLASSPSSGLLPKLAYEAARHDNPEALEWLFTKGLTLPSESLNNGIFHGALESESIPVFQVLLNHGFDLNTHWSESLGDGLVIAAMRGNVPLAKFLLEHGQDPNDGAASGDMEAVTWAIIGDSPSLEIVELMIQHGFDPRGRGAAIAAAEVDNLEFLKFFLDHGVDIEEKGMWWMVTDNESTDSAGTALYRACRAGKERTVNYLLERGADPNSVDMIGRSCMDVARARGHEDVLKLLREHVSKK